MIMKDIGIVYDMPYKWTQGYLWRLKAYRMWKCMWERVTENPYYVDCKIHENFRLFSNFLKWLENEPRFEEFCTTCSEVKWCIDKDMKLKGNKNYSPEFMTLCTQSENSKEQITRNVNPNIYKLKPIIGLGNNILLFKYIKESKIKGFNSAHIVSCCKKKRKSHKGYKWYYVNYSHFKKYRVKRGESFVKNYR